MNGQEILAKFGISQKLAYGLFVQSLFVILATAIALWDFASLSQSGFNYMFLTNLASFMLCISLLVYSFYGFNAKKDQEVYYTAAVILYIVVLVLGIMTNLFNTHNPAGYVEIITLIAALYFLYAYKKSYRIAQYAMLAIVALQIAVVIWLVMSGVNWYIGLRMIILPVTIALTHFERVLRGKYPNIR